MKTSDILNTGIKLIKNVNRFNFGSGSISELNRLIDIKREEANKLHKNCNVVFFIDIFFKKNINKIQGINIEMNDLTIFVSTLKEPYTKQIDEYKNFLIEKGFNDPCAIVGIGGGTTMDSAKAVSNLLKNPGSASDYQGWDLLKNPGVFKIGIPTISGTGSETTRTCVMTNSHTGLKLGMNSDYTVFDHIIMDPDLTDSVPQNQYFYTGMDAYIHCFESLNGSYRNAIGDAYSRESISLCKEVFLSENMMSANNREKLMVASYLGGCAIASSYVGIVHPFSAGLSVVLGTHHCIANCIVMRAMEEFYPDVYTEFWEMVAKQGVEIPEGICKDLTDVQFEALINATVIHQKPLTNALGENFREILTNEKVISIFKKM
jgi:3-deoxy-alpha-D-manno-octulosonate 8-oxidase